MSFKGAFTASNLQKSEATSLTLSHHSDSRPRNTPRSSFLVLTYHTTSRSHSWYFWPSSLCSVPQYSTPVFPRYFLQSLHMTSFTATVESLISELVQSLMKRSTISRCLLVSKPSMAFLQFG